MKTNQFLKGKNKLNTKSLNPSVSLIGLFLIMFSFNNSINLYAQSIPSEVNEAFNKKYPDAVEIKWVKENEHEYESSFKINRIRYSANFSDKGEWLETETGISFDKLPEKVRDAFNKKHKGISVSGAAFIETSQGIKKYEVEYIKGKKLVELFYDENGNIKKK